MAEEGVVLDSSALIALFRNEPGAMTVEANLRNSHISAVNWSEFLQTAAWYGASLESLLERFERVGLEVVNFTEPDADHAARLWPLAQPIGASLADRACMALAIDLGLPILTADRRWTELDLPVAVESIR